MNGAAPEMLGRALWALVRSGRPPSARAAWLLRRAPQALQRELEACLDELRLIREQAAAESAERTRSGRLGQDAFDACADRRRAAPRPAHGSLVRAPDAGRVLPFTVSHRKSPTGDRT